MQSPPRVSFDSLVVARQLKRDPQSVLGLRNFKLAFPFEFDEANAQVGPPEVHGEVRALLLPRGPPEYVGGDHGDVLAFFGESSLEHLDEAIHDPVGS